MAPYLADVGVVTAIGSTVNVSGAAGRARFTACINPLVKEDIGASDLEVFRLLRACDTTQHGHGDESCGERLHCELN